MKLLREILNQFKEGPLVALFYCIVYALVILGITGLILYFGSLL